MAVAIICCLFVQALRHSFASATAEHISFEKAADGSTATHIPIPATAGAPLVVRLVVISHRSEQAVAQRSDRTDTHAGAVATTGVGKAASRTAALAPDVVTGCTG